MLISLKNVLKYIVRLSIRLVDYLEIQLYIKHIHGSQQVLRHSNDCIVVSLMRDAEFFLEDFIRHYTKLGVRHIYILDNGSQDRTLEIATKYKNVTLYRCLLPYKTHKDKMWYFLAQKLSMGRWCLIVDSDEFFDYPHSDSISLEQFIEYLNSHNYDAVMTQMLDMYGDGSIDMYSELLPENFKKDHVWFELRSIQGKEIYSSLENKIKNTNLKLHLGGVRNRFFGSLPCISKFSLLKPNLINYRIGSHLISWANVADISCVLFHYTFANNFTKRVNRIVSEESYYKNSLEYKKYQKGLELNSGNSLMFEHSVRYSSITQLVDLEFLQESQDYIAYCELKRRN